MFQSRTPYGVGWPLAARLEPHSDSADPFRYSTSSAAEFASPRPAFTVTYGSTPMIRASSMYSSIPRSLGCIALQARSNMGARRSLGPIAPCQSQFDTKFPPGRRQTPERMDLRIRVESARQPLMLSAGMSEAAPTWNWPDPVPEISSRAFVASDRK